MYLQSLPNFDRFPDGPVWLSHDHTPLTGKDLNRFIQAIEALDSEVYDLQERLDSLERQTYDHLNGYL